MFQSSTQTRPKAQREASVNRPASINRFLAILLAWTLPFAVFSVSAMRIDGEPAKPLTSNIDKAKSTLDNSFQAAFDPVSPTVTFFIVDPQRIEAAKRANVSSLRKSTQIGITQLAEGESFAGGDVAMVWRAAPTGGLVAQFKARSPGAVATRVGLKLSGLPLDAVLRLASADAPAMVEHVASFSEASTLLDGQGRYWTPMTAGDTQLLELHLPSTRTAGAAAGVTAEVAAISHIFASLTDNFKAATQPKAIGTCYVDTICPTQTQGLVNAKNAVAHMVYQAGCGLNGAQASCVCTGTLLNDSDNTTQIPYFYGANHCISLQSEANTLTTYWNYDNPTCGGAISIARRPDSWPAARSCSTQMRQPTYFFCA